MLNTSGQERFHPKTKKNVGMACERNQLPQTPLHTGTGKCGLISKGVRVAASSQTIIAIRLRDFGGRVAQELVRLEKHVIGIDRTFCIARNDTRARTGSSGQHSAREQKYSDRAV
ncbi:hypothetical protein [Yoonia rosea]|uniref:hypothetical protein n=1 Tax=Yoonia rosea TaxID=287098 RepID=UPI0010544CDA|nr:hypothetical protein [Yoonia rosea]